MDKILEIGEKNILKNGTILYNTGDPVNNIFYIQKGLVRLYIGNWYTLSIAKEGAFLGLAEASGKQPFRNTAKVLEESVIVTISAEKFLKILNKDAGIRNRLIKKISQEKNFADASFE